MGMARAVAVFGRGGAVEATRWRPGSTLGVGLLVCFMLIAGGASPVAAQDATWLASPTTSDFNTATNWSTATVPTGIATFGASSITSLSLSTSTTIGGWTFNSAASAYTFANNNSATLSFTGAGIVINGGSASITSNNAFGGVTFNGSSTAGNARITNDNGQVNFNGTSTAGSASITNNATLYFNYSSTAGGASITNNQYLSFYGDNSTAGSASITNNAQLAFTGSSSAAGSATITNNSGGTTTFYFTSSGGTARFIMNGTGALDISGLSSGGTTAGSIEGNGNVFLGAKNLAVGGDNLSTTFSGVVQDGGSGGGGSGGTLTKEGSGTLTLSGSNTYTGATTVNAGTLIVDGSIASSIGLTVNAGSIIGGTGTLTSTTIMSGGTLAPGSSTSTMTVNGNLTFNNGATYAVPVSPGSAGRTNVTGTATLAGTVNAAFQQGAYLTRSYTILSATGGLGGTTFDGLATNNSNFSSNLSYTTTDVLLNLAAVLGGGTSLNGNQQNIATAINTYFNHGGTLPAGVGTLFGLSGTALASGLSQVSGEAATGAQQGAFQLGNSYLSLLTDPYATNRVGAGGALGFAPEGQSSLPASIASAYARYTKAPPVVTYEPHWDVWGAAFGGDNTTRGDMTVGSHDAYTRAGGIAAGADYRFAPNALIGFSLAGGNINWSLTGAGVTGGGTSDAFLAAVYGKYSAGPGYVSGALSYANYWTSTSRTVTVAGLDQLNADYNAQSFGGRIEGGYRLFTGIWNVTWTPYGAAQGQSFSTPGYGESATTGSNQFALNFSSRTATAYRGELGLRTDKVVPIDNGGQLNLFGRFAYARDAISDPAAAANFTTLALGAAPFIVYGARPSRDLALTTAGAEWSLAGGISFLAKFDGEFGDRSQSYAATGRLRYTW